MELLGHVGERLSKLLLAEWQLANGPDLGIRLELLLVLVAQSTALKGNDLGRRIGVVSDRGAALAAEDAVDRLARGALARPALGGAIEVELVLGDDDDERICRAALALAVITMVVADNEGVGIDSVLDGTAEAVTGETHCCCCCGVESGGESKMIVSDDVGLMKRGREA